MIEKHENVLSAFRHNFIIRQSDSQFLKFSPLFPWQSLKATDFDELDGCVYADLDDETYGPINYKQASIYQYLKFKKSK